MTNQVGKLALLWREDPEMRRQATPDNNRWRAIFAALAAAGIHAEPTIFCEEAAGEIREQRLRVEGVLVWVNPIQDGRQRFALDGCCRCSTPGTIPFLAAMSPTSLSVIMKRGGRICPFEQSPK
jgi:hypothetical protein